MKLIFSIFLIAIVCMMIMGSVIFGYMIVDELTCAWDKVRRHWHNLDRK